MNLILLSGGSGKRLWPLSNEVRSKQFLKIFTREDGVRESMAQRMLRMIKNVDTNAKITIATSENQIPQIKAQLGENVGISIEPTRRDTFPAITLAAAYLKQNGVDPGESIIVCPVDPFVNEEYFEHLKLLVEATQDACAANLTLMGIKPYYSSDKYGYIIPERNDILSPVKEFKEKPDVATAEKYIKAGALWNAGVFAFKLSYILDQALKYFGTYSYDELFNGYDKLPIISFDYAIVEKEKSINVLRFDGEWKDLGTWDTLTEAMTDSFSGKVTAHNCENTHIVNELGIPVIALGITNAVIAATPDGILVSDKKVSSRLKDYVVSTRPMYEHTEWGEYRVLDYKMNQNHINSLVKEIIILEGEYISYQFHKHRTEIWSFTEGNGELIIEGEKKTVQQGDVVVIKARIKHAIKAVTEIHIIEVQIGDELTEDDVVRLNWNWT